MAENFKLPGSSYDEFTKIILAYASGKSGQPMSLDVVAQYASMDKTIVSRNNGFLVQCGLVSEGNQKAATELGIKLGRAYQLKMDTEISRIWRELIENDEFLTRMLSAIRIRKAMEKAAFINHIVYSSGASAGKNAKTGATTLVELLKVAGLVSEQDGQIIATDENSSTLELVENKEDGQPSRPDNYHQEVHSQVVCTPQGTININININVSPDDLDTLSEKLKTLIESLKG